MYMRPCAHAYSYQRAISTGKNKQTKTPLHSTFTCSSAKSSFIGKLLIRFLYIHKQKIVKQKLERQGPSTFYKPEPVLERE